MEFTWIIVIFAFCFISLVMLVALVCLLTGGDKHEDKLFEDDLKFRRFIKNYDEHSKNP